MSEAEMTVRGNVPAPEDIRTLRRALLRGVLRALAIIGGPAALLGSYSAYMTQDTWLIPIYAVVYGFVLTIAFWKRAPYALQAWSVLGLMYGMSIIELLDGGMSGEGRVFLLTLVLMAALLFGRRESIIALILATLTIATFGWAYSTGRVVGAVDPQAVSVDLTWWVNSAIVMLMLGATLTVAQNYLIPRLVGALARSQTLARELEAHQDMLEAQVAERTADLARRNTHLEAAAQIAREAAAIQDVGHVLEETVRLISDRFGFYHAGIFLLDEAGEYAVLRAASSEGGQQMLAHGHRLQVGRQGIVGYVTGQGHPRIALDVGTDAVFFNNPDLPNTRSEMALPLRARGEIIGALDVQSTEPAAFSDEDVAVLQTLADQVAMAISNAGLFQQVQESLEAERRAYGTASREAWEELFYTQPNLGQRYDPQGILPTDGRWREEMKLAAQKGETVPGEAGALPTIATPIKVRGQVIGVLDAHKPDDAGAWTPEEIALLETLTDQLGIALESARLYQDAQRRAIREQMIGEVTARMRETLDVDIVLQTAVRQIGEALGLHEVTIRLETDVDQRS
jgi:GAF domain-containing protein